MKTLSFIFTLLFASFASARDNYVPFDDTGLYKCENGEVVSGVRYDDTGNKSLMGIWCSPIPALNSDIENYFSINDGGNGKYDVKCGGQEMISGFDFSEDLDPSVEGMFCKRVEHGSHGSSMYRRVEGLRGKHYNVMCREGSYVSGVKYREGLDDTVLGIHCTQFECENCES